MSTKDHQQLIANALRRLTVWIFDAAVERQGPGWSARRLLDPNVAASRGDQQGLRDTSLRSAIRDQSVVDLLDTYIAAAHDSLLASCQIVSREFDLSLEPERGEPAPHRSHPQSAFLPEDPHPSMVGFPASPSPRRYS